MVDFWMDRFPWNSMDLILTEEARISWIPTRQKIMTKKIKTVFFMFRTTGHQTTSFSADIMRQWLHYESLSPRQKDTIFDIDRSDPSIGHRFFYPDYP